MRRATALAVVVVALVLGATAVADISPYMSYQGVLRDGSGSPVPDGSYLVTFRIYNVVLGGTPLWTETNTLWVSDGVFNATLGLTVPLTPLGFDVPYWLGISVEGEPELTPRTVLTTVPYAAHAGFADTVLEGDDDWDFNGDDIYRAFGNVGIGQASPAVRLDVVAGDAGCARFENASTGSNFTLRAVNDMGTAGAFFGGTVASSYPVPPAAVYGAGGPGTRGGHFSSAGSDGIYTSSPSGKAIWAESTGNYAGFFTGGGYGVYVQDMLETGAFKMSGGAAAGYVMTSDVSGVGTWQPAGTGADSDWTISGSDMYAGVSGNVGIGETAPTAKLQVRSATEEALEVLFDSGVGRVVNIERTTNALQNQDMLQLTVPAGSDYLSQFIECERGGTVEFTVDADGYVTSNEGALFNGTVQVNGTAAVYGPIAATSNVDRAAEFSTDYLSAGTRVVSAVASATGSADVTGVYGESVPADWYGLGGEFKGGYRGVVGIVTPTGGASYTGVYGYVDGGTGTNYAIRGYALGGTTNWAGYFSGDVNVTGTLVGGSPVFKVDHPLDPEGKYLMHAGVESDQMMNIYNGNATLDERGEATVEMPDWFEAFNQDFRYQLTCIGGFAPVYIAETIRDNRFRIAGGEPGMVVSWQVTGVRNDAFARANPVAVEVDKGPGDIGKYVHPEAFGRPLSQAVGYEEPRDRGPASSGITVPETRTLDRGQD